MHYDLNVTYTFEPSLSSGDPAHDKIVTLNIPLYVSLHVIFCHRTLCDDILPCIVQVLLLKVEGYKGGMNPYEKAFIRNVIEDARQLSGEGGLFRTILVRDLLFGYNDSLLLYLIDVFNSLPFASAKNFSKDINPFFGLEVYTSYCTLSAPF